MPRTTAIVRDLPFPAILSRRPCSRRPWTAHLASPHLNVSSACRGARACRLQFALGAGVCQSQLICSSLSAQAVLLQKTLGKHLLSYLSSTPCSKPSTQLLFPNAFTRPPPSPLSNPNGWRGATSACLVYQCGGPVRGIAWGKRTRRRVISAGMLLLAKPTKRGVNHSSRRLLVPGLPGQLCPAERFAAQPRRVALRA